MGRPKKVDQPEKNDKDQNDQADKGGEKAELMISVEQFARTRDSVITGLTTLQHAVGELINSYIKHSNSVLGGGSGDTLAISNPLASTVANGPTGASSPAPVPTLVAPAEPAGKQKKKREKKERDPNAPKRPLTAAFLFSQHARPIVKKDLEDALQPGQKLEPNAINLEINKRWGELPEAEKEAWKASYRGSLAEYRTKMAEYLKQKGENPADVVSPHEDEGDEEVAVGAAQSEADASAEEEEAQPEKEPTPPPKAPTPPVVKTPKARKSRAKAVKDSAAPNSSAVAASSPIPPPTASKNTQVPPPSSEPAAAPAPEKLTAAEKRKKKEPEPVADEPRKKRSRKSKGGEAEAEAEKPVEAPVPEKKQPRRKRKSDVA